MHGVTCFSVAVLLASLMQQTLQEVNVNGCQLSSVSASVFPSTMVYILILADK